MVNKHYNLLLSYTWEYDKEFADRVKKVFDKHKLNVYIFNEEGLNDLLGYLREKSYTFDAYIDRASDVDEAFEPVAEILRETNTTIINPQEVAEKAVDKAIVHPIALEAGLDLPRSFIIPPYEGNPVLQLTDYDLESLGRPFIIKPCYYTGGSEGVHKNAQTINDIDRTRVENPDDNYLVQEKIYPKEIMGKRAWFRVLWAFGKINIIYWDDIKLEYCEINSNEFHLINIPEMEKISRKLASISNLDYFSTEVAITENNRYIVIDYVNDQCDMRLKSNHPDGVPENLVDWFIESLIENVIKTKRPYPLQ